MPEDFIEPRQRIDDVRVFEIRLAAVIGLDDTKFGNRLAVDVGRQVTESSCCAQQLVLVSA